MDIVKPNSVANTASFTRASVGRYRDRNYVMQQAANDVPRFDYDPATGVCRLLNEPAATNSIRNNSGQGAVVGGALPTNWSVSLPAGLACSVAAVGTDNGVDYVDLRVYGTATAAGEAVIYPEATNQVAAASGQTWAGSAYVKLAAGTLAGLAPRISVGERNAAGASLVHSTAAFTPDSSTVITGQRVSVSRAFSDPAAAYATLGIRSPVDLGAVVDATLRIGLPQLERDRVTSPIRTTNAAANRAADTIPAGCKYITNLPENDYAAWNANALYSTGDRCISTTTHKVYESLRGAKSVVTITNANPGVVAWAAHGLAASAKVRFSTTGALPTGLVAGTDYYVAAAGLTVNSFSVSATAGGAAIATTSAGNGVHTCYEVANLNFDPTVAANSVDGTQSTVDDSVMWLIVGSTNKYRLADGRVSDQTTAANVLEFAILPGQITTLGFCNVNAATASVAMDDPLSDGPIFGRVVDLSADNVGDWYDYFFAPIIWKTDFVVDELPIYDGCIVTVSLRAEGDTVACGEVVAGMLRNLGDAQWGAKPGMMNFGKTKTDGYGQRDLKKGDYSKRLTLDIFVDNDYVDESVRLLEENRDTPLLFIGGDFACTILFGFYTDYDCVLQSPAGSFLTSTIEGL